MAKIGTPSTTTPPTPPTGNSNSKPWYQIDISLSLTLLIPAIITVLGWYFANNLEAQRDRENKLRDIKVQFDIQSYFLINSAGLKSKSKNLNVYLSGMKELDSVFTTIQLVGSEDQINLVKSTMEKLRRIGAGVDTDPIVNSLRDDLRKELNLDPIGIPVTHVTSNLDTTLRN